jgi:hypothetical protein
LLLQLLLLLLLLLLPPHCVTCAGGALPTRPRYHPDKQRDPERAAEAAEKFKRANRAYKILTDPTKRQAYNDVITLLWDIDEGT